MSCGVRHSEFVVIDEREKQSLSEKGQPNGYASLDASGKVPASQINFGTYATTQYVDQQRAATETGVAQTYATKASLDAYLTKSDAANGYATKVALDAYLTKTDASTTYATKASLGDYVRTNTKNVAAGYAGLDGSGKVSPDVLVYKSFGSFDIAGNTIYNPGTMQGLVGFMTANAGVTLSIPAVAVFGGAQVGGVTAIYNIGLGELAITADSSITLYVPTGKLAVIPAGGLAVLTARSPTFYVLNGTLKASA